MQRPFRPERSILEVAGGCTLRCVSCTRWRNAVETIGGGTARRIQEQLRHAGVRIVTYLGGEPFLHPDLLELARHACALGLRAAVVTNGTLLTPAKIEEIVEEGLFDTVIFSLDGVGEQHDVARGARGAFARAAQALDLMVQEKRRRKMKRPKIFVYDTVSRLNHTGLLNLFDFARSRGVNAVKFISASVVTAEVKAGTAACFDEPAILQHSYECEENTQLQPEDLPRVQEQLGIIMERSRVSGLRVEVEEYLWNGRGTDTCGFLGKDLVIGMDGDVHLCPMLPQYAAGNALQQPLAEMFSAPRLTDQLTKLAELLHSRRLPICTVCCIGKLAPSSV